MPTWPKKGSHHPWTQLGRPHSVLPVLPPRCPWPRPAKPPQWTLPLTVDFRRVHHNCFFPSQWFTGDETLIFLGLHPQLGLTSHCLSDSCGHSYFPSNKGHHGKKTPQPQEPGLSHAASSLWNRVHHGCSSSSK